MKNVETEPEQLGQLSEWFERLIPLSINPQSFLEKKQRVQVWNRMIDEANEKNSDFLVVGYTINDTLSYKVNTRIREQRMRKNAEGIEEFYQIVTNWARFRAMTQHYRTNAISVFGVFALSRP